MPSEDQAEGLRQAFKKPAKLDGIPLAYLGDQCMPGMKEIWWV